MTRLGIPRALLWYQYYPMWRSFFEELGVEVVTTGPTKRSMVVAGSSRLVSETCLPVKVFCGHVMELTEMGVDSIFIPAIKSTELKVYNCSKFIGLPDMMKAVVKDLPEVIALDVDVNQGKRTFFSMIYEAGRRFHWNPFKVKAAGDRALADYENYQRLMQQGMFPEQAWCAVMGESPSADSVHLREGASGSKEERVKIAVIGHPYNLYDTYTNHSLLHRLQGMGVDVVTPEMLTDEQKLQGITKLVGSAYWTYEGEVVGAGGYYLDDPSVDGVISVVAFGCGPDSVMTDPLQRIAKDPGTKPYMMLALDEHTGEAGLVTRLEAFVDMLRRRMRLGQYQATNGR
jgi:predicted nucleotide-binding protein (sugar kinase/HSP70/actin superfamily)